MSVRQLREQLRPLDSRGAWLTASIWLSSPEAGTDRGTSCATIIFHVTIKPRAPSIGPMWSVVVINPGPRAHEAEEDALGRPDHDSHVPMPHDQVARLRMFDPLKSLDSVVEIVGIGIGVRKAGALVNRMHQVRTIVSCIPAHPRIERSRDHTQAIVSTECSSRFSPMVPTLAMRVGTLGWASCLLRRTDAEGKPAKHSHDHGFCRNPHGPSLMRNPRCGEITVVH